MHARVSCAHARAHVRLYVNYLKHIIEQPVITVTIEYPTKNNFLCISKCLMSIADISISTYNHRSYFDVSFLIFDSSSFFLVVVERSLSSYTII